MVANNEIRFLVSAEVRLEIDQLSTQFGLSPMQLSRSLFGYGLEEAKAKLLNGFVVALIPEPVSRILHIKYIKK